VKQAQQQVQEAKAESVLTASELSELERLRRQEADWRQTEVALRKELTAARATPSPETAAAPKPEPTATERAELERLRKIEQGAERETAQLREQLTAANTQLARSQQAEGALRKAYEELQARVVERVSPVDTSEIEQLLRDYEAAYKQRNAEAVVRLMPSAKIADLTKSFSDARAYGMEIQDPQISVKGDTATVTCVRRVTIEPRVGKGPAPRLIPTVFRLKQSEGIWKIESVEEKR